MSPLGAAPPADDPDLEEVDPATLPDWLREAQGGGASASAPPIPEWLRDDAPSSPAPNPPIPEWLRDDAAPLTGSAPTPAPGGSPSAAPSWLLDDEPAEPAAGDTGMLGSVDLPAWLRPTGGEPARESAPEATAVQTADWLQSLGIDEATEAGNGLGGAPAVTRQLAPLPTPLERTPERLAAIALLERLVTNPFPAPSAQPQAGARRWWQRIGLERFIATLLLAAILVPLMVPNLPLHGSGAPGTDAAAALFAKIDTLATDDRIIIAYESHVRQTAEIGPLEKAVVDHIAQQRIPALFVSTEIQGNLVMQQRAASLKTHPINDEGLLQTDDKGELVSAGTDLCEKDPAVAGYCPGPQSLFIGPLTPREPSLRALAQDVRNFVTPRLPGGAKIEDVGVFSAFNSRGEYERPVISKMNDFDLLIIVADDPDDVRVWMEQVVRNTNISVAVLTTSENAPLSQPYLVGGGEHYQLVGIRGAQAYLAQRGEGGVHVAPLDALTVSSLAIVLVLMGGGIAGLQQRRRKKETD